MFKVILIADDDDLVRGAMLRIVRGKINSLPVKARANIRSTIVVNGVPEGIAEVRKLLAQSPGVDFRVALFTDGKMPDDDRAVMRYGDELIGELQELIGRQRMPVTVMMAGDPERRDKATALGAHFIAKPFDAESIYTFLVPFLEMEFS